MITNSLSDKIRVMSFVAIILVLYIHSGFHDYPHEILGMQFNHYLQEAISGKLGRCAVPLFYMISGFLFFQNTETLSDIMQKMKKRIKTLLVPFIIAALYFPVFQLLMECLPFTTGMSNVGGEKFHHELTKPIGHILSCLFYKTPDNSMPWAFHLWFLRDLIIIVACSPILFYLKKYIKSELVCVSLFALSYFDLEVFPFVSLFWFIAGDAFLGQFDKWQSLTWPVLYIALSVVEICYPGEWQIYFKIPVIFIGIMALWTVYEIAVGNSFYLKQHRYICTACKVHFIFIYLFHEPTLNVVRKLLIFLLGRTSFGFAINYLLSPWIFAILFIFVGLVFKKYLPKIYSVCVGGR